MIKAIQTTKTSASLIKPGVVSLSVLFIAIACSQPPPQTAECVKPANQAGEQLTADDYEIDNRAFVSTFLQPEVARLYGIEHDDDLGVVVVSVYRKSATGLGVDACVSGGFRNLMGHSTTLAFDEIREGEAIYHVGTFPFIQEEHLTFEVEVEIAATGRKHDLKWTQQFWPE